MSRRTPGSRAHTCTKWIIATALMLLSVSAQAELIKVITDADAIPAPLGSLRLAIERAESTLPADQIVFADEIQSITLVAPLPDITQGLLTIGRPVPFDPNQLEVAPEVTISGAGNITHALKITGPDVGLHRLGFEGFVGDAAVEYLVAPTSIEISGCRFGGVTLGNSLAGLLIRVSSVANLPGEIDVRHSQFFSNARGLEAKISLPSVVSRKLSVRNNRFGLPQFLGGSLSNGTALSLSNGAWHVINNVVSGTGHGFELSGTDRAHISDNRFGLPGSFSTACDGPDLGLITLRAAPQAVIEGNQVRCALGEAIRVLAGSHGTLVRDNRITQELFDTPIAGAGIIVEDAQDVVVRDNQVRSDGLAVDVRGTAERTVVSCNALYGAIAPLQVTPPAASPPSVSTASPLSARVSVLDPDQGWVELFAGPSANGIRFYGSHATAPNDADLAVALEVLELTVQKAGNTASIAWDESLDPVVTATRWRPGVNSSEPGSAISMNDADYLFDVIRGSVGALSRANDGSVDLGPVDCLADDRVPGMSLLVTDPDLPPAGESFFYVVRRDTSLSPRAGSYDPAVCGLDLHSFQGPRRAQSGDCGP